MLTANCFSVSSEPSSAHPLGLTFPRVLAQLRRSYSMFKVRRGGLEEIPLIQGKEQWLLSAGAAVKRYPTSKVRETQERW